MTTIQLRRGTATAWTVKNPVLAAGEAGLETDTGKLKIGDGTTRWSSLGYSFEGLTESGAQALIDSSLTDYYTASEVDTAIAGIAPTAANTSASTAAWGGNLNGVTGDVQSALDAIDDLTLGGTPADGSITLAKLADLAQDKLIGRATASTGVPEAIACTAAGRALLDDATNTDQRTTLGLGTAAVAATGDFAAASHTHLAADLPKLSALTAPDASVNFADQQALSFRIENRTSDPASPTVGQLWLRTDL